MTFCKRPLRLMPWLVAASVFCSSLIIVRAAKTDTNVFGFSGPEIFPIDPDVESLHVADIDGDGLNDIIIANNTRSKIDILYNQTGKTNITKKAGSDKSDINRLPPDARFRIDSIASE